MWSSRATSVKKAVMTQNLTKNGLFIQSEAAGKGIPGRRCLGFAVSLSYYDIDLAVSGKKKLNISTVTVFLGSATPSIQPSAQFQDAIQSSSFQCPNILLNC